MEEKSVNINKLQDLSERPYPYQQFQVAGNKVYIFVSWNPKYWQQFVQIQSIRFKSPDHKFNTCKSQTF